MTQMKPPPENPGRFTLSSKTPSGNGARADVGLFQQTVRSIAKRVNDGPVNPHLVVKVRAGREAG